MISRILDSLTLFASGAFGVVPLIGLLLALWPPTWLRIWKHLDTFLRVALTCVQKKFLSHKEIIGQQWDDSFAERVFFLRFTAVLIAFVAFFPFGGLNPFIAKCREVVCIKLLGSAVVQETPFRYWEIAVFLWSAIFFIVVQIYDGYHYADAVFHSCGKAYRRGLISTVVFIMFTCFFYQLMIRSESPRLRLSADAGLVLLFCVQDLFFMKSYSKEYQVEQNLVKKRRLDKTSDNYLWFLLLLDIPGLFAFGVVLAYLLHCKFINANQEWQSPFASGAAAFNLLLINVVYSALAVWQKYEDAKKPAAECGVPVSQLEPAR